MKVEFPVVSTPVVYYIMILPENLRNRGRQKILFSLILFSCERKKIFQKDSVFKIFFRKKNFESFSEIFFRSIEKDSFFKNLFSKKELRSFLGNLFSKTEKRFFFQNSFFEKRKELQENLFSDKKFSHYKIKIKD